jgi:hypothetical protein
MVLQINKDIERNYQNYTPFHNLMILPLFNKPTNISNQGGCCAIQKENYKKNLIKTLNIKITK